jgi:hypothetical protein
MTVNIENKPKVKDMISAVLFDFKLKAKNIGKIGSIHGDNIEITPIKKEINGKISI